MVLLPLLMLVACAEPAAIADDIVAPDAALFRPTTVALDNYEVALRFADGQRCVIAAIPGERDGTEEGWSRYETDCDGVASLRVEFLPPLRPGPPDPAFPQIPSPVPDYTGRLDILRLPSPDLEGAAVSFTGPGGRGEFLRWPGHDAAGVGN